jgi:hypothetical protein
MLKTRFYNSGACYPDPVRVSISHNQSRAEAMQAVDGALGKLFSTVLPPPIRMDNLEKSWSGSVLNFGLRVAIGPFRSAIRGTITVTDNEIIIEADLPKLLTSVVPERSIQSGVETRIRGLLK